MNDYYTDYEASVCLNDTYWHLAKALGYPETEPGVMEVTPSEILVDTLHMIELGHRYLDLTEN